MGTAGLPFPTSNNAPLPIPGGYGNPTGANPGGFFNYGASPNLGFNFPAYGSPSPVGPSYNVGSFTGTNLAGLNSGLGFAYGQGYGTDLYNRLGKAYGRGAGQLIGNILSGGLYNPQVAAAYLNAQQPGIARGEAGILGAFGDAGARFSSAAALGLGDYESQVQLNQQQMLAQLYQNAQQEELGLLTGVLPTLHQERANQGSWLNDLVGGLEIAGGIVGAPFTGGLSLGMIPAGISQITGSGRGGGASAAPVMPGMTGYGGVPIAYNTGTFGANAPTWSGALPTSQQFQSSWFDPSMTDAQWMASQGYAPNNPAVLQSSAGGIWQNPLDTGTGDSGNVPIPIY